MAYDAVGLKLIGILFVIVPIATLAAPSKIGTVGNALISTSSTHT
jgi:hypothetical protein